MDKSYAKTMRFIANFAIIFGLFFSVFQLFFSRFLFVTCLIPVIAGYYLRQRVVSVCSINSDRIILIKGEKEIILVKSDILSITKSFRYTITDRYWLILSFYNKSRGKKGRYFFVNEPEGNFLKLFKDMGIPLKNVP